MKMIDYIKRPSFILVTIVALVFAACSDKTSTHQTVDVDAFAEVLKSKDITLIDLRTPEETAGGMIEGAIEMDFRDASFDKKLTELPRDKPYAVYCKGGGRSGKALNQMKELGFSEVYDLAGGYSGWIKAKNQ